MNNINKELSILRGEIDIIDQRLLALFSKRATIVRRIGKLKHANKIQPLDSKRWSEVLRSNTANAKSHGLSSKFIKKIFKVMHEYSLSLQKVK